MPDFKVHAPFEPTGDQPEAIRRLSEGVAKGLKEQVLLGATGTGKSVRGSEPVLVGRVDEYARVSWSVEPIGPLVDGEIERRGASTDEWGTHVVDTTRDVPAYVVATVDPATHATVVRPVTALSRHATPDVLWRVTTEDGRSVVVTGDHNVVRLGRDARLETIRTSDLVVGDRLPLPSRTPEPMEPQARHDLAPGLMGKGFFVTGPEVLDRSVDSVRRRYLATGAGASLDALGPERVAVLERFGPTHIKSGAGWARHRIPASIPLDSDWLRLLGEFVAEGHAATQYATITPGPEDIGPVRGLLDACGIEHFVQGDIELGIGSRVVTETLRDLCGSKAAGKHLPGFWASLSDADLGSLLAGYFQGDGWVETRGVSVCAATKSERLASELGYALLRFGIVARLRRVWKRAVGTSHPGDWYWLVAIRGADDIRAFAQHVGFLGERKRRQLDELTHKVVGGNSDTLPAAGHLLRQARISLGAYEREVADLAGMTRTGLDLIENGERELRRGTARALVRALEQIAAEREPVIVSGYLEAMDALHRLLACRWATVARIEQVEPEGRYVYDFSVAGAETFMAGFGGLVVHNTFSIAQTIQNAGKPTLVLAHNKTLAAQLYSEFRDFFPDNAVEYFVSYFDYYQPEAYLPRSDTYIEKDSSRNDEIDKLRHAATRALFERKDVIIVASVSCIYGLGAPVDYGATVVRLRTGGRYRRDGILRQLVDLQYQRNDQALSRARFRVRGDTLELQPAYDDFIVRVQFFGDEVERITELDPVTGEILAERKELNVYPASHYVTPADKLKEALVDIEAEAEQRTAELEARGMVLEAERLRQRTAFDVEMMRELGFCSGIENYSRHLSRREAGSRPWTLLDYFPRDWLLVVDESHMTIPQVVGMYKNDRTRKEILVDFGFRLPSALDNRPLTFEEFEEHLDQVIYMSATPGAYELQRSKQVVQQLIRPTGIVDPGIEIHQTEGQIDDLMDRIRGRVERGERVLVTTLTKKMAEDLADYLHELGIKVSYLHSEVDTLERVQILRDLRLGVYDVLVGINLLREGIDLPEVTLVAILDADKEGFLRSAWSLIQVIGRAARNVGGEVVMYADRITESMQVAIDETNRRRGVQERYNEERGITPRTIIKDIRDINDRLRAVAEAPGAYGSGAAGGELSEMSKTQVDKLVGQLEASMRAAAKELEFERAAAIRDEIQSIRMRVLEEDASTAVLRAAERAAGAKAAGASTAGAKAAGAKAAGASAAGGGPTAKPSERIRAQSAGERRGRRAAEASALEVTEVEVLRAGEEPAVGEPVAVGADGHLNAHGDAEPDPDTAADWLPGLRDEHEDDDAGWMARWLDRSTWDRSVTPNVIKRTGERRTSRGRRR